MTKNRRYMMATKATHKLGDLSSEKPDICMIHHEDDENYIGEWVFGFGFIEVKFPKETTRELTAEEKKRYNGTFVSLSGCNREINIDDPENERIFIGGKVIHPPEAAIAA